MVNPPYVMNGCALIIHTLDFVLNLLLSTLLSIIKFVSFHPTLKLYIYF